MDGVEQVPKRPLGKTGLDVSVIGFGSSPLGGVYNVSRPLIPAVLHNGRLAVFKRITPSAGLKVWFPCPVRYLLSFFLLS